MPRELKFIISPLLIVCFLLLSFGAGFTLAWNRMPVLEAWDFLKQKYIAQEELDDWGIFLRGIFLGPEEMVGALEDPWTDYLTRSEYAAFEEKIGGSFIGIGVEVTVDQDGNLMVIAPLPGSPAEKAGIEPGDVILTIDGASTSGMSLWDAVLRIRGEEGVPVVLEVRHRNGETAEITIIREQINIPTVSWEMLANDIAHIEVSHFSENTGADLRSYLEKALDQGAQGIILDLRNNPGGLIDAAVTVASQFLPEGSAVLTAKDGYGTETTWTAEPGGLAIDSDISLVVLVNGFSASASEVVAGALQDYGRAKLIGTTTFGKGSVNLLQLLSDGSALYVTHGRWYTPNGRLIEGIGLTPDIEEPDANLQLQRAIDYILGETS